ncbi:MAG TPA: CoA ester lyase [Caulobacteraceae bacterium]|jgi:citrate lyase subunit beta/citryl-CoA lyase
MTMIPRSWLFVPADDPRKLAKIAASGADAVILDLEDSVTPARKAEARALALEALNGLRSGPGPQAWVRINPLPGRLADQDLAAVMPGAPDGVILPKCASAADVAALGARLDSLEAGDRRGRTRILPIATETPAALFALGSYAQAPSARLAGLTWGAEDLSTAVGAETNRAPDGGYTDLCRLARALCLAGAAAAGLPAIETVYTDLKDVTGLEAYAARGRREGFSGMLAIHPAQVEPINRAFTPSAQAVEQARRIVALFEANPGAGVLAMDGRMLDAPHFAQATRILQSTRSEAADD